LWASTRPKYIEVVRGENTIFAFAALDVSDAAFRWPVRLALAFYLLALLGRQRGSQTGAPRMVWTLGFAFFLVHMAAAFHFVHGWSHDAAYEATARQSFEVTGLAWGGGVYANDLFALVWGLDVAWWWLGPLSYQNRSVAVEAAVQGYLGFIAFNATVVFGHGWVRWAGTIAAVLLTAAAWQAWRRRARHDAARPVR
jgi:hypothetical protein